MRYLLQYIGRLIALLTIITSLAIVLGMIFPSTVIAYRRTCLIHQCVYMYDLRGHQQILWSTQDNLYSAWAPDLSQSVYLDADEHVTHVALRAPGDSPKRIARDQIYTFNPVWNPQAQNLVYAVQNKIGQTVFRVIEVNGQVSSEIEIDGLPVFNSTASWSQDGQKLVAFSQNDNPTENTTHNIWLMDATDGSSEQIGTANRTYAQWSPDGEQVIVSVWLDAKGLRVIPVQHPDATHLVNTTGYPQFFTWLSDNQQIVYITANGRDTELVLLNPQTDTQSVIRSFSDIGFEQLKWTSNGEQFITIGRTWTERSIYLVNTRTGEIHSHVSIPDITNLIGLVEW